MPDPSEIRTLFQQEMHPVDKESPMRNTADQQAQHNRDAQDARLIAARAHMRGLDCYGSPVELGPPAAEEADPNMPGSGRPGPHPSEAERLTRTRR